MMPSDSDPRATSRAMRRARTVSVRHAGGEGAAWPVTAPIVTSTAWATHDPDEIRRHRERGEPTYNRDHFPNVQQLERLVADLEGAEAGYATASGMAAISLVALALLSQGDHLVLGAGGYSDTEEFLVHELARYGITCSVVDVRDRAAVRGAIQSNTRMIFAETVSNPGIVVADIPMLAAIAHERDLPLVIDNTLPTPVLCQPIAHGADLVVHSVTKFLGGHHDLSAGVIVGGERWMGHLRRVGYLLGAVPGAHDAALAVRGIRTIVPRMDWISRSASMIAEFLDERPEIATVRYPGGTNDDDAELAARLMPDGYGGVMVVELAGPDAEARAAAFVRALRSILYVSSLGGDLTTVCYPPRLRVGDEREGGGSGNALRFSIGLEDSDDLIADLQQALDSLDR